MNPGGGVKRWAVAIGWIGVTTAGLVSETSAQAATRADAAKDAAAAHAEAPKDATGSKDEYAREVEAAVEAYNQDDFATARKHFATAHELRPSARTWRGLGTTAFELKSFDDAVRELTFALEDQRSGLPPDLRSETELMLRVARRRLSERDVHVPAHGSTVSVSKTPIVSGDSEPVEDRGGGITGQRIAALGLAGAGLVSVGVGGVFGVRSLSKGHERDRLCPDSGTGCSPAAVRAADAALTAGNIATVASIVGGVALAGGVVLWLTGAAPERKVSSKA